MQKSDIEGFKRSGAIARKSGESFHANPHYDNTSTWATVEHMLKWHDAASAWAAGWLTEDNGRDQALAQKLKLKYW